MVRTEKEWVNLSETLLVPQLLDIRFGGVVADHAGCVMQLY